MPIITNLIDAFNRDIVWDPGNPGAFARQVLAEGNCEITAWTAGDLVEETAAVIELAGSPIVCESCRCDVRAFSSVGFARIRAIMDGQDTIAGWFRLCERCYCRAVAEDDPRQWELAESGAAYEPHFRFLCRLWPGGVMDAYRDGWRRWK